jgi:hypothetical protein
MQTGFGGGNPSESFPRSVRTLNDRFYVLMRESGAYILVIIGITNTSFGL